MAGGESEEEEEEEEEPADAEDMVLEEAPAGAGEVEVEEAPAQPAAGLAAALQAEAKAVVAEALDPDRDLRREQLRKKQADVAKKEEKKKAACREGKKEGRERRKEATRRADHVAQVLLLTLKVLSKKNRRPRKPRKDRSEVALAKMVVSTMQEFMRSYTSKKYVKSQEQLHKVPGFNLYFAREAAAFKMQDAEGKARQIGYFGLRLDKCCSQAVNVYLARAYYDKMASESLSCEWADSEPGLDYRALLINTADFAHKCLKRMSCCAGPSGLGFQRLDAAASQEGLHQKGKSKGDILQSILFFAQQSGKGGAKGKDWGSKEKGQGESSSGVPPPPPGDGAGAPPPPPPPPEETGVGGEGMSEPEPETRREPEAVGRVVHEPKQMPKTTAPKPAAPKQEEFAPKGGATKPPEPAKPPSTAIPTSAKLPEAGHFVSN
eukprot:symbB.v1.2.041457.t1/scaffold8228.1/size7185/1